MAVIDVSSCDLTSRRRASFWSKPGSLELADVKLLHSGPKAGQPRCDHRFHLRFGPGFRAYVRNLSGVQRPIDAYLAEMLDGLADDLVMFMLRTAILDRLSAPLCEAVTGVTASRALLASIEKQQLLLTALDQDGQWYRYHPLLAEHLKERLVELRRDLRCTNVLLISLLPGAVESRPACDFNENTGSGAQLDQERRDGPGEDR